MFISIYYCTSGMSTVRKIAIKIQSYQEIPRWCRNRTKEKQLKCELWVPLCQGFMTSYDDLDTTIFTDSRFVLFLQINVIQFVYNVSVGRTENLNLDLSAKPKLTVS